MTRRLIGLGLLLIVLTAGAGCKPAGTASPRAAGAVTTASTARKSGSITAADVREVLTSIEEAGLASDYKVDVPKFAASIVGQLPIYLDTSDPSLGPTTFREPESTSQRQMTSAEASSTVDEAVSAFDRIAAAQGRDRADAAMISAGRGDGHVQLSASDGRSLSLLAEGAGRLTFMFGQPNPNQWTWKVTDVAIVGTDTADVTYHVAAARGKPFRFTRSSATKRLRFERRPTDGAWMLDGWLDYPGFESSVKSSIKPADEIPNLVPNWWDSLGAE